MYDIVQGIIAHAYDTSYGGEQQYIYYICSSLIIIFTCVFIDLVYRVFSHFWNGRR